MKFIDLFAGIGGFHSGLTKAGMECVGWCEQDKYAQASYHALYPTLTCVKGGGIEPKILLSRNPNVIRKLTPREFWRLQGFTDEQFDTCAKIQSNAQLYKQAGNSVSIPIVYELGKKIIEHHRRLHGNE